MERPDMAGKWKKPGKDQILIGILVGVLLLVIALPQNSDSQKEPAGAAEIPMEETQVPETAEKMEQELQKVLEQVA